MQQHYLDNSATTKPCEQAVAAALNAMTTDFGNPSSLPGLGLAAENLVATAREQLAERLGADVREVYFTSGGSEGNNTALFGAAHARRRLGRHIIATAVEHDSVLMPLKQLEKQGFEVTYLAPGPDGNLQPEQFKNALRPDTILVTCMAVNNETGAVFPVTRLREVLQAAGSKALLHTDCVQAFGKLPVDALDWGVDLLSASAHKVHGLKGCGLLYIKKGLNLPPLIYGGGQESGLRSGTEAVPNISAFGAAVKALPSSTDFLKHTKSLQALLRERLQGFQNVQINSPQNGCPYILNFSFTGYRSETLLHFLAQRGVFVSSGSACAKGKGSHVLLAQGLPKNRVDSALRVSFSYQNTPEDVLALCSALTEAQGLVHR